ncbi:MAG: tetratricopeptide repeat protein [Candidatus Hydrogenedentes bacterium]|nr:tetratricopeptide repeat protein [Candidatus Hydrogenedentota bacterium]
MGKKTDAREKFKHADQMFREKNYPAALETLDELDKEFPDTKNVIYPRAMCLARVGRFDEALDLCRQLKVEFGDPRGEKLMTKIGDLRKAQIQKEKEKKEPKPQTGQAVPSPNVFSLDSNTPPIEERLKGKNIEFSPSFNPQGMGQSVIPGPENLGVQLDALDLGDGSPVMDMAALDDMFAAKPATSVVPPIKTPPPSSKKGLFIGIAAGAAVLIALIVFGLMAGGGGSSPQQAAAPQATSAQPGGEPAEQPAAPEMDGPDISWLNSLEEVSERMGEDDYYALLLFYSSSTPSADVDLMETTVWNDPSVRYFAKDWVCAKIDVDKEPDAKEMFQITKLPTTVLTDYSFEEEYYRQEGYLDTQKFYTAMIENGFGPETSEEEMKLPPLPMLAMILLPFVYIACTFFPILFTMMLLGRMPEDDMVSGLLQMVLVGIISPFLGLIVLRGVYQLGRVETLIYYAILAPHLLVGNAIMSAASGMPFWVWVMGMFAIMRSGG